jgi:hypothetical protein
MFVLLSLFFLKTPRVANPFTEDDQNHGEKYITLREISPSAFHFAVYRTRVDSVKPDFPNIEIRGSALTYRREIV